MFDFVVKIGSDIDQKGITELLKKSERRAGIRFSFSVALVAVVVSLSFAEIVPNNIVAFILWGIGFLGILWGSIALKCK